MTPTALAVLLANMIFDASGHLSFKAVSTRASRHDGLAHWRSMALNPLLWIGIVIFVVEFLLWMALMSLVPLSVGVLVGCLNIIGVMVGGWLVFREEITAPRLAAIGLIALGVTLVGWGAA